MGDAERLVRAHQRALTKRDAAVGRIRRIHTLALNASSDRAVLRQVLVAVEDLDNLWSSFTAENDRLLDVMIEQDKLSEFSQDLEAQVRAWMYEIRAIINVHEAEVSASDGGPQQQSTSSNIEPHCDQQFVRAQAKLAIQEDPPVAPPLVIQSMAPICGQSRLPELPLPIFDGQLQNWPAFRDRFRSLVDSRTNISNVEKFYYLLGCLQAESLEVLNGITVSNETYTIAWAALVQRFDKPRKLASSTIDKLLSASIANVENLPALNKFLSTFDDNIALLESFEIPDLSSFILFCMASRCLPLTTRRLFESENVEEYPSINKIIQFVKNRVHVLENAGASSAPSSSKLPSNVVKRPTVRNEAPVTFMSTTKALPATEAKCPCCSGPHDLSKCSRFKSLPIDDRYSIVCTNRLCMVCLCEGHMSFKCSSECSVCKRRHHALLHRNQPAKSKSGPSQAALLGTQQSPTVLLGTALVHVVDAYGECQPVRALIDSASQISAVTTDCSARLGLKSSRWTMPVMGLSGQQVPNIKGSVKICVRPRDSSSISIAATAWVLPSITSNMPARQLPPTVRAKCDTLVLADPLFDLPAPVELLLGADVFPQVWSEKCVSLGLGYPSAYSSVFGWVLIGPVQFGPEIVPQSALTSFTTSLETLMKRFWETEEPEAAPPQFTEDGLCESIFKAEMYQDVKGRFTVPLPVRKECSKVSFPGMRQVALKRFYQLENKLIKNQVLYKAYKDFMREFEALGHMTRSDDDGNYFIPHHGVFKTVGDDLKLRVVFDASAKSQSGKSLNDCLLVGPKLQQDIVDVLIGFRLHRIAFVTDICKMYRQIWVHPKYLSYQHILWRELPHEQVKEYTLNTVTYGLNCAPYLALRVLQHIAETDCADAPAVSKALRHQTYMDDICVGAETVKEAKVLQRSLTRVLARSGLELKKWASNSSELLSKLPAEDVVCGPLSFERHEEIHVLGMQWMPNDDVFTYDLSSLKLVLSKRGILSSIARIFDPLGFLSPAILYAKSIMQRLWQANISWDEPLPSDIGDEWCRFYESSSYLSQIQVPRHVGSSANCRYHLCGFCDASDRGYAAVVYLRVTDPLLGVSVYLLGAKTKLAPMKETTTPRLELCGAVLLSVWLSRIKFVLEAHLVIDGVFAWTDSTVVLSWLVHAHTSFKTFVSNRVHKILKNLPDCHWSHVRSELNPADCASRGLAPYELYDHRLYWSGPMFLKDCLQSWDSTIPVLSIEELPESKLVSLVAANSTPPEEWYQRFSSYNKMLRVIVYMRRFIARCRRKAAEVGFLTSSELNEALFIVVKYTQTLFLSQLCNDLAKGCLVKKPFSLLCPFIDLTGVIRVGGRLRNAKLSENRKHPILVPKNAYLAVLIARHWHYVACHARPRLLTALIQRQFWIPNIRRIIHKVIRQCVTCVKFSAVNPQPIMADLPAHRVQQCRTFSSVGIDYAGPLTMKEVSLRKAREFKVYIALFICMGTKAIHLEVVTEVSTAAFLAALDRFTSRRGLPESIFTDCGTNFVGAARHLRKLVNDPANRERISGHIVCEWYFNPPSAPHFGGIWEAGVKSTKSLLIRTMGSQTWTLEELTTLLCRVEAALNSRPLTQLTSDPNDFVCLTPGHFIIGQPLLAVPDGVEVDGPTNTRNRWKLLRQVFQHFWHRWSLEYLNTLQPRARWPNVQTNLNPGAMVVIKDASPPLQWRLGRVVEVIFGSDQTVRVAKVLTSQGILVRPVVKLVVLPTE